MLNKSSPSIEPCGTPVRDDTHMMSMKTVQFSRPPTPLSIYVRNSLAPSPLGRPILNETLPPLLSRWYCGWERTKKNKNKTKSRHNQIDHYLSKRSIFRFSPKNNAVVSLKDYFTDWRQKEDFLFIILIFGSTWCLVMAQTRFSLMKNK